MICSDECGQRGPRERATSDGEKLKTEDSRVTAIGALDVHSRAVTLPLLGISVHSEYCIHLTNVTSRTILSLLNAACVIIELSDDGGLILDNDHID